MKLNRLLILFLTPVLLTGCEFTQKIQCSFFGKNCEKTEKTNDISNKSDNLVNLDKTSQNNVKSNTQELPAEFNNLNAEQLVEKADQLNKAKRFEDALPLYRKAADLGHDGAQILLMDLYLNDPVLQNVPENERLQIVLNYLNQLSQSKNNGMPLVSNIIMGVSYIDNSNHKINDEINHIISLNDSNPNNPISKIIHGLQKLLSNKKDDNKGIEYLNKALSMLNTSEKGKQIQSRINNILAYTALKNNNTTDALRYFLIAGNDNNIEELCRQQKALIKPLLEEYQRLNQSITPEQRALNTEYKTLRTVLLNLGEINQQQ